MSTEDKGVMRGPSPSAETGVASRLLGGDRPSLWQPIETAPHDGKRVLLYAEVWDGTWGSVQQGAFRDGQWETSEGSVGEDEEWGYEDDEDGPTCLGPTHWQPLPLPPPPAKQAPEAPLVSAERSSQHEP